MVSDFRFLVCFTTCMLTPPILTIFFLFSSYLNWQALDLFQTKCSALLKFPTKVMILLFYLFWLLHLEVILFHIALRHWKGVFVLLTFWSSSIFITLTCSPYKFEVSSSNSIVRVKNDETVLSLHDYSKDSFSCLPVYTL